MNSLERKISFRHKQGGHRCVLMVAIAAMLFSFAAAANRAAPPIYLQFKVAEAVIDKRFSSEFAACIETSGGITAEMQDCIGHEYARLDALLNGAYSATLRRLGSNRARAQLRHLERDWLQMRWDACLEEMDALGGGSASDLVYRNCQLRELIRRTMWIEEYRT